MTPTTLTPIGYALRGHANAADNMCVKACAKLAAALADEPPYWMNLIHGANDVAYAQGQVDVFTSAIGVVTANPDTERDTLTRWLLDQSCHRADDQWSGRANDGRRSYADGRNDAYSTIRSILLFVRPWEASV